ncbi:MAG: hypothetical protein WKF79_00030 [Nocardioides sp.]
MTREEKVEMWAAARAGLEPQAHVLEPAEAATAYSIAISLKRIADCLDGTAMGVDVSESLAGLAHAFIYGKNQ